MHRHFFSLRIAMAVIAAGLFVGWCSIAVNGFVVVHDPAERIAAATLVFGDAQVQMRRLNDRYWVGRPVRDGQVELTCRDGSRVVPPGAYVTAGMRTTVTVEGRLCSRTLASPGTNP